MTTTPQKLQLKVIDSDLVGKTITFNNGQSDVTVTQVQAFLEGYNSIYRNDAQLQAAYWVPKVNSIKLFE